MLWDFPSNDYIVSWSVLYNYIIGKEAVQHSVEQPLFVEITLLDSFLYYCLSISLSAKAYAPSDIAVLAPIFENITPIRFCGSYVTSLSVP